VLVNNMRANVVFLNKMCYELMHGQAPRVSHFRDFGCQCFILKKGRLDKFEWRSSDGIFLGYASHSRAFRVLDTNFVMETCEHYVKNNDS
jgi:hypothetical protein